MRVYAVTYTSGGREHITNLFLTKDGAMQKYYHLKQFPKLFRNLTYIEFKPDVTQVSLKSTL